MEARLRRALARTNDRRAMLEELLAAWESYPAPELADAIERVCPFEGVPPELGDHAGWLTCAERGDPCDIPALVDTLRGGDERTSIERLTALDRPDPRIEMALFGEMSIRRDIVWEDFQHAVLERARRARDPRVLSTRGLWTFGFTDMPVRELERLLRVLEDRFREPIVLSDAERALLAQVVAASPQSTRGQLLAAVYADPASDAPRLVYADHLQQQGDSHGDVIVEQILHESGPVRILKPEWIGAIGPEVVALQEARFERGFLVACKLLSDVEVRVGHPAWSTVRDLEGGGPALVTHPVMHNLERIVLHHVCWAELATGIERRCKELDVRVKLVEEPAEWERHITALAEGAALPDLRALSIATHEVFGSAWRPTLAHYEPLLRGALVERLDYLYLQGSGGDPIGAWIARLDHVSRLPLLRLCHGTSENPTVFDFHCAHGAWRLFAIHGHWPGTGTDPVPLVRQLNAHLVSLPPETVAGDLEISFARDSAWHTHDDPRSHSACRAIAKTARRFPAATQIVVKRGGNDATVRTYLVHK